jgi:hypothetical protein
MAVKDILARSEVQVSLVMSGSPSMIVMLSGEFSPWWTEEI